MLTSRLCQVNLPEFPARGGASNRVHSRTGALASTPAYGMGTSELCFFQPEASRAWCQEYSDIAQVGNLRSNCAICMELVWSLYGTCMEHHRIPWLAHPRSE